MTQRRATIAGASSPAGCRAALLLGISVLLPACSSSTSAARALAASRECVALDHEHRAWSALLRRYSKDGWVDYARLRRQGKKALDGYLGTLAGVCKQSYRGWTREQRLAFWINVYNAYTIKLVLDHYPLASIRSIGLLPGAAWRQELIPIWRLRDDKLSLNDVEHGILRKDFDEPRIHFAIVCASRSCPKLRAEAFRADRIQRQLDASARAFLGDRTKNRLDVGRNTLELSSIFKWFKGDFERKGRTLVQYAARYLPAATAAKLDVAKTKVAFLPYDWSLNGR